MYFSDQFIGRASDLAVLAELFARGERLVTVTGPPGIGKTRLAWEYAARLESHRVCFVELDEAHTREAFLARVAEVLGLSVEADGDPELRIGRELADRELAFVVLDGIEQIVPDVAGSLGRWRRDASRTTFVATSRELLRIREEVAYELLPLDLRERAAGELSEAVQLLLERSYRRRERQALAAEEHAIAQRIVEQLDGIPLAIELAAARVRALGLRAVHDRLPFGLDLLAHGARDQTSRQRTLRAAIAWSWDLLDAGDQAVLAQCSVFRGSFSLEAAEAIVSCDGGSGLVVDHLQRLREKSLLRLIALAGGNARFELYGAIRHYAAERLAALGSTSAVELRHARYYIGPNAAGIESANFTAAIRRVVQHAERTSDDLARACDALIERKSLVLATGDMDSYLALFDFVLEVADELDVARRAIAHNTRGDIRRMRGMLALASEDFETACALARETCDARLAGRIQRNQGALAFSQGELARARAHFEEALRLGTDDRELAGVTLADLGTLDRSQGLLDDANRRLETALGMVRAAGDRRYELVVVGNLGLVELDRGDPGRARGHFDAAAELCLELNSELFAAYTRSCLGMVLHLEGKLEAALALYEPSIAAIRASGSRRFEAVCLGYCGVAELERAQLDSAVACLRGAERIAHEIGDRFHESVFGGYLAIALATGDRAAEAESCLERASAFAGSPRTGELARIARLRVELSRTGDAPGVEAKHRAHSPTIRSFDLQLAVRILERALTTARGVRRDPAADPATVDTLVVDVRGRWFHFAGRKVSCQRRPVIRRLLQRFIEERVGAPGRPISTDDLKSAGWPDERISTASANLRLRVALTSLRNLGLRDVLVTQEDGYLLAASVPVRIVTDDDAASIR